MTGVRQGDIVRFQADESTWFYCRVDEVLDGGDVLCEIVDTQSWANLALAGYLPGRQYHMPEGSVLSIVAHE